jgi:predicted DNA-binding transcriptional regulator AlpA
MATVKTAAFEAAQLLTELEAATLLNVSHRSLQNWRVRGGGPQFVKIGGRIVRYRCADLVSWLEQQLRRNTSQLSA